jgi:hypothetical protein
MSHDEDVFEDEPSGGWTPPPAVRLHNGEMIPVDADFFQEPPPEIGEIVTAQSTLVTSKHPFSTLVRLMLVVGLTGLMFYAFVIGLRLLMKNPLDADLGYVVGTVAALVTLPLTIYLTRFKHTCTYVGKAGIAEFTLSGNRDNTPRTRVLLFDNCTDITTWQMRQYVNGVYSCTQYKNIWRDDAGRDLFKLEGNFRSEQGTPKAISPFWFASAAEVYWNEFAFQRMVRDYESQGYLDFRVKKKDIVRVGNGYLEFTFGGKMTRLTPDDIKTLSLANGSFTSTPKRPAGSAARGSSASSTAAWGTPNCSCSRWSGWRGIRSPDARNAPLRKRRVAAQPCYGLTRRCVRSSLVRVV